MPPARWFSTIVVALLGTLASPGVFAQGSSNDYSVGGIDVDATGADAVQAREIGLREARRKASAMLVERLVAPEDRARVPVPDDARLQSMVRGIEFVRERSAAGRYIATLNVVFSPAATKAWLAGSGVRTAETVARPALVIPLWKGKAGLEPMDDGNPWRDAWRTLDTTGSAMPVTVVRGDSTDQDSASVEQAYVGDIAALSRLNERYRAPVVIVAVVEGDREGGQLTVGGLRYDTQTGARSEIPQGTVSDAGQLGDAAKTMHGRLDEQWRGVAVVRRDTQDALDVYVPIRALGDWVQIRQRLGSVPAVKSIVVRTLESDRADLRLEYFGTPEELQRTLALAGLTLDRDASRWRLQVR